MVHYLMKIEPKKFRAYLASLKDAKDESKRVELFENRAGAITTVSEQVDSHQAAVAVPP